MFKTVIIAMVIYFMYKKVYLEITNNCNLSCDFCIKNKRKRKFMTQEEFKIILKKLKGITNYLYFHVLGEPLLHPLINEFIDLASQNYKINITTNGYLIDRIKNNTNINIINISLHSYDSKYKIPLEKYLENVLNSVDCLLENDTKVNLRLWVDNQHNNSIIEYINNHYQTNIKQKKCQIKKNLYLDISTNFIWPDLNNNYYSEKGRCYGLITHFGILVDGTIVPCCLDSKGDINLGNIFKDDINKVLNKDICRIMVEGFKNQKKIQELCKHCKFLD